MTDNPILVEVHRGSRVESRHRGAAVAVDAGGEVVFAIGDIAASTYPRSALKLFQAIPLVESGAAKNYDLSPREIALACASHNAESFHVDAVGAWLARLGLNLDALECGAQAPMDKNAARDLISRGEKPTRAHHNCSGKHAGMLTLAKHLNAATRGYAEYSHPAQRAWMETLSELVDIDVFALAWERDGCGLPAICMPLELLARAFACYAAPAQIANQKRAKAMTQITTAIRAHPDMLAGSNRCCTDVIRAFAGRVIIKTGAEGVYGGFIPDRQIGFAVKIDDGADRAAKAAVGAVLKKLGVLDVKLATELETHFCPQIVNAQGDVTGRIVGVLES